MKRNFFILGQVLVGACFSIGMIASSSLADITETQVGSVTLRDFLGARVTDIAGQERLIYYNDPVFHQETISTGAKERTDIQLVDKTFLQIGENSSIVLDSFIYDPETSAGSAAIEFGTGAFRWVSGELDSQSYNLDTGAATLSIRGTAFRMRVEPDGTTIVYIEDGEVAMDPCGGDDQASTPGYSIIAFGDCSGSTAVEGDATNTSGEFGATQSAASLGKETSGGPGSGGPGSDGDDGDGGGSKANAGKGNGSEGGGADTDPGRSGGKNNGGD